MIRNYLCNLPISLVILCASMINYLGFTMYFSYCSLNNVSICLAKLLEYFPGSTPWLAHPPTPSQTVKILELWK